MSKIVKYFKILKFIKILASDSYSFQSWVSELANWNWDSLFEIFNQETKAYWDWNYLLPKLHTGIRLIIIFFAKIIFI